MSSKSREYRDKALRRWLKTGKHVEVEPGGWQVLEKRIVQPLALLVAFPSLKRNKLAAYTPRKWRLQQLRDELDAEMRG